MGSGIRAVVCLVVVAFVAGLQQCGTPTARASQRFIGTETPTAEPPPLRSDKYLDDSSLITGLPCKAPCYLEITPGKTTFADAVAITKSITSFQNIQVFDATSDQPALMEWSALGGVTCCHIVADKEGLVESIMLRLVPKVTIGHVLEIYGEPQYSFGTEYTEDEVVTQLLFPDIGMVLWVATGDADSSLDGDDPVVATLYLSPELLKRLIEQAVSQGWAEYDPFKNRTEAVPNPTASHLITPTP